MFLIYWSNSGKIRLVIGEETSEKGAVKIMLFSASGEMATGKNLFLNIFFLVPQMT